MESPIPVCRVRGVRTPDSQVFARFGRLLKAARLRAGYTSPQEFCDAIDGKTGIQVSYRSMYRYEGGESIPRTEVFLAVAQTLSPGVFIEVLALALEGQAFEARFDPELEGIRLSLGAEAGLFAFEAPDEYQLQMEFEDL
jgi:hypothetical protein